MEERTLFIIKPDGVARKLVGECLLRLEKAELEIAAICSTKFSKAFAQEFYKHLKLELRPKLFDAITAYLSESMVVACIIRGDNVVERVRDICGPTDPSQAPHGTIRGDFGLDDLKAKARLDQATQNVVHASASCGEAESEIQLLEDYLRNTPSLVERSSERNEA